MCILLKTADVYVTENSYRCLCYRKQLMWTFQKIADVLCYREQLISWCACVRNVCWHACCRKWLLCILQKTADVCVTENSLWHEAGLLQHTLHCQTTETVLQFWHPQTASLAVQQSRCQPASQVTILTHTQKMTAEEEKNGKKGCHWLVNPSTARPSYTQDPNT